MILLLISFDTEVWQSEKPEADDIRDVMLKVGKEAGKPYLSGLVSLGVSDGKIHEILPGK